MPAERRRPSRPATSGRAARAPAPRAAAPPAPLATGDPVRAASRVELPPPEIKDIADVLLENPSIPENKRYCGNPECNQPVGRGRDGEPGRTEGFCRKCRHPFSFTPKLAPQTVVGTQYEVQGCLAHGGLGWIYLARDLKVGRWVVLKGLLSNENVDVIRAELGFLAEVDHPNIVKVHNFVEHDGEPYIVMEYVRGATLRKTLEQRKAANNGEPDPLPPSQAVEVDARGAARVRVPPPPGSALLRLQARQRHPHRFVAEAHRHGRGVPDGRHDQRHLRHAGISGPGDRRHRAHASRPTSTPSVARSRCSCTDTRGYQTTFAKSLPAADEVPAVRGVRLALPLPRARDRGRPRRPLPVGRRDGGAARRRPAGDRGG